MAWHRAYSLKKDESCCNTDSREGVGSQAVTVYGDAMPILETFEPDLDPAPRSVYLFTSCNVVVVVELGGMRTSILIASSASGSCAVVNGQP